MSRVMSVEELFESEDRRFNAAYHVAEGLPQGRVLTDAELMTITFTKAVKRLRLNRVFDPYTIAVDLKASPTRFIQFLKEYAECRGLEVTFITEEGKGCKIIKKKGTPRGLH